MPEIDPWRYEVSEALGRIEANITNLAERKTNHEERITHLESKQFRRDGIIGVIILILPFLPFLWEPLKRAFG